MDYQQVVREQIDNLRELQKRALTSGNDIESVCRIAENNIDAL